MTAQENLNIGLYHLGLLYSEAFSGLIYDFTDALHQLFGVGINDPQSTIRIIALLHETSHFIHDLSLGTCLNIDFLLDEAAAITFSILSRSEIKDKIVCPLIDTVEIPNHRKKENLNILIERQWLTEIPLSQPTLLDTSSLSLDDDSGLPDKIALTGTHLLEGIVAVKTLIGLAQRAKSDEDLEYLREWRSELPLLPDKLSSTYNLALRLFDALLGVRLTGVNPRKLRSWPDDALAYTPRRLLDIGFLYVSDIALHVPPVEIIAKRIELRQNNLMDFQPVPRFIKAMTILQEENGFPPAGEGKGKGFYEVLFDWLAVRAGWPGYRETQATWEAKLLSFREKRRSMSDGYRFRMLVQRREQSIDMLINDAISACASQLVPLVHITPNGMKLLRFFGYSNDEGKAKHALSLPLDFSTIPVWELINFDAITWENVPENSSFEDALEVEMPKAMTFLQEIVMRSMCRALQLAVLKENFLRCPWAKRGCHVALQECTNITNLDSIPQKECTLRKYLELKGINSSRLIWEEKS
ncbi:MAG: hypothetical protein QNJ51_17635 [Calothrix sp. MO_167.B12]|nr:hypothetical protein [Calothrix sp. MO_167.B12]